MSERVVNENLIIGEVDGKQVWAVELGPQIVRKKMTVEVLDNDVTAMHYQPGLRDAVGNVIKVGEVSTIVDWKQKFSKRHWKIYSIGDRVNQDGTVTPDVMLLIDAKSDRAEAVKFAKAYYKEKGYAVHS